MRFRTLTIACAVVLATPVRRGEEAFAQRASNRPTSPTLGPGPVVYQFEIHRTTEPLSAVNVLPPPLPLSEVMRLKGERPTTGPLFNVARMTKAGNPAAALGAERTSASLDRGDTSKTLSSASLLTVRSGALPPKSTGGVPLAPTRADVVRNQAAASPAPAAPLSFPKPSPPLPTFREYPDTVVLIGGQALPCRILADVGTALRVELDNGAIVHLPKQRILRSKQKAPAK